MNVEKKQGADRLCNYRTADLCLCFCMTRLIFSLADNMHDIFPLKLDVDILQKNPPPKNISVPCRTRKKYSCPFAAGMKIDSRLFVVSHDAKLLFSGGHWDNSLQVINVGKARKINHIVRHIGIVMTFQFC